MIETRQIEKGDILKVKINNFRLGLFKVWYVKNNDIYIDWDCAWHPIDIKDDFKVINDEELYLINKLKGLHHKRCDILHNNPKNLTFEELKNFARCSL